MKPTAERVVEVLLMEALEVLPVMQDDLTEVWELLMQEYGGHGDWVRGLIDSATDWSLSRKVSQDGRIVGVYALGNCQLGDYLNKEVERGERISPHTDLSRFDALTGVEGVALVVGKDWRGIGAGRMLKDSIRQVRADYIWGEQLKSLGNLDHWLKRRELVAETAGSYFTVEML